MSFQPISQYKYSIYALFFLMLLILALPQPTQAYYLTQSPDPFTMHGERENAPPSDKKGVFTVQDNFNIFTRTDGTSPILLPHSDYFIAADTIDINIPIFGIFSHPKQTNKDPLANMLYANLQVKKLLEEYAEIQKMAHDLLGRSRVTMPSGKIITTESTENSPHTSPEKPAREHLSIKQKLDLVQTKLAATSTLQKKQVTPASTAVNNGRQASDNALILTFHELQKQVALQTQRPTAHIMSHSAQTGKIPTHNTLNQSLYESGQNTPRSSPPNKSTYSGTGEISLPWVLELPFKIFNYILAHKITALVMGLILLLLFNFIFGARS